MPFRNSATGEYPVTHEQIRAANRNTSYPAYFESADGYDWVAPVVPPEHDPLTQYREEGAPIQVSGAWEQTWVVKDFSPEEIAQRIAARQQMLIRTITDATQARLDTFARTRNYDGILPACTYATSVNPKFQSEGRYCVEVRDSTWATLYAIMEEVEQGNRPAPTGFEDVEGELPALAWPA